MTAALQAHQEPRLSGATAASSPLGNRAFTHTSSATETMDESPSAALNAEYTSTQNKEGQQRRIDSSHGTMGADTEVPGHGSMNGGLEEGDQGPLETGGLKNGVKMAQAFSTDASEEDEEEKAEGGEGELHSGERPTTPTAATHADHGVDPEMVKQEKMAKLGSHSPSEVTASPEPVPEPVESPEDPEPTKSQEAEEPPAPPTESEGDAVGADPPTDPSPVDEAKEEEGHAESALTEPPTTEGHAEPAATEPPTTTNADVAPAQEEQSPPANVAIPSSLADGQTGHTEDEHEEDDHEGDEGVLCQVLPMPTPHPELPFPCLRGRLRKTGDGRVACSGNWGMSLEDFKAGGLTSRFEFSCRPPGGPTSLPMDGTYLGFFFMQTPKGPAKYEDTCRLIHTPNASGGWNISGSGKNKCGAYDISGTLSGEFDLEIFRVFSHLLPPGSSNKSVSNKSAARKSGGVEAPRLQAQDSMSSPVVTKEHTIMSSTMSLGDGAMSPISYLTEANSVADGVAPDSPCAVPAPAPAPAPPTFVLTIPAPAPAPAPAPPAPSPPRPVPARAPEPPPPIISSVPPVTSIAPLAPAMVSKAGRVLKIPSKMDEREPVRLDRNLAKCQELLGHMVKHKDSFFFREAVDPIRHSAPNYFDIIKEPRDLSLIKNKLEYGEYLSPEEFAEDVRLIFHNAYRYNPDFNHAVHIAAKSLESMFETKWAAMQRFFNSMPSSSYLEPASPMSSLSRPTLGGRKSSISSQIGGIQRTTSLPSSRPQRAASLNAGKKRQRTSQSSDEWADDGWMSGGSGTYDDLLEDGLDGDDTLMLEDHSSASSMNRPRNSGGGGPRKSGGRGGGAPKRGRASGGGRGRGGQGRKRKAPLSPAAAPDETTQELLRRIAALERENKRNKGDDEVPLSYDEKRNLRVSIEKLPAEKASRVVDIISESTNLSQGEDEEVEIDIDSLDTRTLRRLQEYVSSCLGGGAKRPMGGGRGRGGAKKRSNGGGGYWRSDDYEDYYDSDYEDP